MGRFLARTGVQNHERELRSASRRDYVFGLLAVAAATLLRWLLDPILGNSVPLVTLFGAIAVTSWIAGSWPAVLVAGLGYALCDYFFIAPRGGFTLFGKVGLVGFLTYSLTCLIIVMTGHAARAARRRALHEIAERRQAEQALRDSEQTHRLLSTIGTLATRAQPHDEPGMEDLNRSILEAVAAEMGVPRCGWTRIDHDAGVFVIEQDAHGALPSLRGTYPIPVVDDWAVANGRSNRPSVVADAAVHPNTRAAYETRFLGFGIRAFITVPVHREGRWVANFWVTSDQVRDWTPGEITLMSVVAERVRLVLEQARVTAELRESEHRLRAAAEAMQEADRRKDEFLAILSHELRNPLAPVRNAAHFLMMKELPDPELRRPIEMIHRQVAQMARLIDDLLDVSRITRGQLELRLERFDFCEAAQAAVDACQDEVDARGHSLFATLPERRVELVADRYRLIQVFSNLIVNAAKYSPAGGRIDFTAFVTGEMLEVRVEDQGIGIQPAQLDEIFELFVQVDRSFEQHGGLGIGLTLARQLVELHGGAIEARSEGIGHGSTFIVRLPVATPSALPAESCDEPTDDGSALRILVADDNRDATESLAMLLRSAGHVVREALDGETALREAAVFLPSVAFLDIGMPKVSGYDVARTLRAQPWGRTIHLIALTGWGQDEDRRRSAEAGFDTHVVKPVAHEELKKLLRAVGARFTPDDSLTPRSGA